MIVMMTGVSQCLMRGGVMLMVAHFPSRGEMEGWVLSFLTCVLMVGWVLSSHAVWMGVVMPAYHTWRVGFRLSVEGCVLPCYLCNHGCWRLHCDSPSQI